MTARRLLIALAVALALQGLALAPQPAYATAADDATADAAASVAIGWLNYCAKMDTMGIQKTGQALHQLDAVVSYTIAVFNQIASPAAEKAFRIRASGLVAQAYAAYLAEIEAAWLDKNGQSATHPVSPHDLYKKLILVP